MGTYASCTFGNLHVMDSKSEVDAALMQVFRRSDRKSAAPDDLGIPAHLRERYSDTIRDDDFRVVYYEAHPSVVRDRLNVAGYTDTAARRVFNEWRRCEIEQFERWQEHGRDYSDDIAQLRELTPEQWMTFVRQIAVENLQLNHEEAHGESFIGKMIRLDETWLGYGGPDFLVALRLAVDACMDLGVFIYDVTELIDGLFIERDDDDVERMVGYSAAAFHAIGRVLILTEGKSDSAFLEDALDILHPHLRDYYSFMDFAEFGGGAGQLANLIRAFAGAGIINRVIALFDNDAAGRAAMRTVKASKLPEHIVVMRLPDLERLRTYPTLGPAGPSLMDINGMAASIELYFGEDTLRAAEGSALPIQWTGYEKSMGTYQGELIAKNEAQTRFREKLARARAEPAFNECTDWSGIQMIFTKIFAAFNELDEKALVSQLRFVYRD
jgi:hypothetical protein